MEFKLLSVTGLQTTPAYFCNLMLTHCAGGDDVRIVVKRTKDGIQWEQEGKLLEDAHVESVWIDANNAFWCSAIPVALSRDLVRVDFIFSEDAESFLRDIVLREMCLSWPEMQITEDERNAEQAAARKGKPGRPRNSDDTWAWQQVNALGRPLTEVKREWIARIGDRWELAADQERMWRAARDSRRNPEEKD